MATRRTSFGKLQRDRAKQANAAAKRERRLERANAEEEVAVIPEGDISPAELLTLVEQLHKQFDDKLIDFEEFEEKKAELMARLPID
jgi:hypothetical protein